MVEYYRVASERHEPNMPVYAKINGTGSVDAIKQRFKDVFETKKIKC